MEGFDDLLRGGSVSLAIVLEAGLEKVCSKLQFVSLLQPHLAYKLPQVCTFLGNTKLELMLSAGNVEEGAGGDSCTAQSPRDPLCAWTSKADNSVTEAGYDLDFAGSAVVGDVDSVTISRVLAFVVGGR